MCGRYSLTTPPDAMRDLFDFSNHPNLAPRFNIAPTQSAPVVRPANDGAEREIVSLRWGLIPGWAKDLSMGAKTINARAETVAEKPSFRQAYRQRRCLVPADGYYEWENRPGGKQPWRVCQYDSKPFAMAGLWESWNGPDGPVESFTIITTAALPSVSTIHHRMPVILPPDRYGPWLDRATAAQDLAALLTPPPDLALRCYRVDKRVGNVRNDDASLLEPVQEAPETPRLL